MSRETRHILRVVSTKEKETFAQWADSQTAWTQHMMLLKGWVLWLASLTSALAWVLLDEGRVIIWWRCVWGSSNLQKLWAFFSFFFFGGGSVCLIQSGGMGGSLVQRIGPALSVDQTESCRRQFYCMQIVLPHAKSMVGKKQVHILPRKVVSLLWMLCACTALWSGQWLPTCLVEYL